MANRKHRKNAAAARVVAPPPPVSEIRVSASSTRPPGEDRDTIPAPPPRPADWQRLDRELTADVLRVERALDADAVRSKRAHRAMSIVAAVDAFADALYVAASQAVRAPSALDAALPHAYEWAREVVAQLRDAVDLRDDDEIGRALRSVLAYSQLFVNGLVEPALCDAIEDARFAGDSEEVSRTLEVYGRASTLLWSLRCAAAEAA